MALKTLKEINEIVDYGRFKMRTHITVYENDIRYYHGDNGELVS